MGGLSGYHNGSTLPTPGANHSAVEVPNSAANTSADLSEDDYAELIDCNNMGTTLNSAGHSEVQTNTPVSFCETTPLAP